MLALDVMNSSMIVKKTAKFGVFEATSRENAISSVETSYLKSCQHLLDDYLYVSYPTYRLSYLSIQERQSLPSTYHSFCTNLSLTYGEVSDLKALQSALTMATKYLAHFKSRQNNKITEVSDSNLPANIHITENNDYCFVDLGSGSGRGVIGAALLSSDKNYNLPFNRFVGIEIILSLHRVALLAKQSLIYKYNNTEKDEHEPHISSNKSIEFFKGSFLDLNLFDWVKNADVVFANSTCFEDSLIQAIGEKAKDMKNGSIFITLSKALPKSSGFKVIDESREAMSW